MRHIRLLLPLLLLSFAADADLIGDGIILGGGICDDSDARTIDALSSTGAATDGCTHARWDIEDGDPNTIDVMDSVTGEIVHFNQFNINDRWYEQGPNLEDYLLENAVFPTDQIVSSLPPLSSDVTLDYAFPDSDLLLYLSLFSSPSATGTDLYSAFRTNPLVYPLDPLNLTFPVAGLIAGGLDAGSTGVISIAALLVDASPTVVAADGREFHAGAFGLFNLCYLEPCPVPDPPVSIPEPGTLVLLGLGLLGMGLAKRRRKEPLA